MDLVSQPSTGTGSPRNPRGPKMLFRHKGKLISGFCVILVLITTFISINALTTQKTQANAPQLVGQQQLQQITNTNRAENETRREAAFNERQNRASVMAAPELPAYNNRGLSLDKDTNVANFDNQGHSYSDDALFDAGLWYYRDFTINGVTFTVPYVTEQDNWLANGQVLPVTPTENAKVLGLIGSSSNGPSRGTAVLTYTDGTTQSVTFNMSDWTLGGNREQVSPGNQIAVALPYRNAPGNVRQTVPTYLFYTQLPLLTDKTIESVKLPTSVNKGQMHIFWYGTGTGVADPVYNNTATSYSAYTKAGNFDGSGNSYPAEQFVHNTPYSNPFQLDYYYEGMSLTRANVLGGYADNIIAQGQIIPINSAGNDTRLGIIGSATNGPSFGTAIIRFTDGSEQSFTLALSDWTLNGNRYTPSYNNRVVAGYDYRHTPTGRQNVFTYLFYQEVRIDPSKVVESVVLPSSTNKGQLHIFSIGTSAEETFNNVGTSSDAHNSLFTTFDNAYNSYSTDLMIKASVKTGYENVNLLMRNGFVFPWRDSYGYQPDNFVAVGQTIPVTPVEGATRIGFLGSSTNGAASGTAWLYYTDGSTQAFELGFTDWCAPNSLQFNNKLALAMPHRKVLNGTQALPNALYYVELPMHEGKTIASVTLPNLSSSNPRAPQMHIFSIATASSSTMNNIGIANDEEARYANLDGVGHSYSAQELQQAGVNSGQKVDFNGVTFAWPTTGYLTADHYVPQGQTIPVQPVENANTLAFLGSSTHGPSAGNFTITYTDGTTKTVKVTFSDWCSTNVVGNNQVAYTMDYRNFGGVRQNIKNYIFYVDVPLDAGKTIQSVTLPTTVDKGKMHIFSIGTK